MARYEKVTSQEKVTMQGSIIDPGSVYYWVCDASGNRLAICWRKEAANRLADALDVIEDIDAMEAEGQP